MTHHILIAGGGIGGMAAAVALLNRGHDVDVFEQAPELKEFGAGVQISPNGTRALHALGVLKTLRQLSCDTEGKEVRLWNTGRTWKLFDLGAEAIERYGFPYVTVFRPDLLQVLVDAVRARKSDAIHLGRRAANVTQHDGRVTLELEDGETIEGDALIGADGVHSVIRHKLYGGDRPCFFGMIAWRGVIPMERVPREISRDKATNWIGVGGPNPPRESFKSCTGMKAPGVLNAHEAKIGPSDVWLLITALSARPSTHSVPIWFAPLRLS